MKKIRAVATDPQREAYYLVEQEIHPRQRHCRDLTRSQVQTVISDVRKLYGLPRISFKREVWPSKFAAWFEPRYSRTGRLIGGTIVFNQDGEQRFTLQTLLHELAHAIVDTKMDAVQHHGPEFIAVVTWLFDHFMVCPQDAFGAILRRYKVRSAGYIAGAPKALKFATRTR